MVAALILAAGRSSRMGQSKALLVQPLSGQTFVAHLVGCARGGGAGRILVVGRPEDDRLKAAAQDADAVFVPNPDADLGQLSSVRAGLAALSDADPGGILVMPVDVPLISPRVVSALIDAASSSPAAIVRAAYRGRHGHPVLFKREVFEELRRADLSTGARAVVRADPSRVADVETAEEGISEDIDTPADYERVFGRKL